LKTMFEQVFGNTHAHVSHSDYACFFHINFLLP
jgi:hypothetical protein